MPNIKKIGMLSIAVVLAQLLLNKIVYPLFGTNLTQYLTGLPLDMSLISILTMVIGTFVLIYAGMFLYDQKTVRLWQGKNLTQRLFAILLYGHILLYVILLVINWNIPNVAVNTLIGLAINLALISFLVTLSANKLKFPRI